MKNSKKLNGCFLIILALGFASCSSIDIVKRHYVNGFYVHVNKKMSTVKMEQAEEKVKPETVSVNESIDNIFADISGGSSFASEANNLSAAFTEVPQMKTPATSISDHSFAFIHNSQNQAETKRVERKIMKLEKKLHKVNFQSTKGDAPTIVLILLCLFLPFIAVGIVDDWGTRFLISLLLTLLFWLPGVIYAFIVCFG